VRSYRFSRFFMATKLFLVGRVIAFSLDAAQQSVTSRNPRATHPQLLQAPLYGH
jgi:hypothetical protein